MSGEFGGECGDTRGDDLGPCTRLYPHLGWHSRVVDGVLVEWTDDGIGGTRVLWDGKPERPT